MMPALLELCFGPSAGDANARIEASAGASRATPSRAEPVAVNDADLLARLRAGDERAFDDLVLERFDKLAAFARGILGDAAAAADAVQEVFGRLWVQRETLQITSLAAYLYRSVRNQALNDVKRASVRARLNESLRPDVTDELEARATDDRAAEIDDPRLAAVRHALDVLSERRRTALHLRYEQGLSYDEVAAVFGTSTNAARQLVFHALRALRVTLGVDDAT